MGVTSYTATRGAERTTSIGALASGRHPETVVYGRPEPALLTCLCMAELTYRGTNTDRVRIVVAYVFRTPQLATGTAAGAAFGMRNSVAYARTELSTTTQENVTVSYENFDENFASRTLVSRTWHDQQHQHQQRNSLLQYSREYPLFFHYVRGFPYSELNQRAAGWGGEESSPSHSRDLPRRLG